MDLTERRQREQTKYRRIFSGQEGENERKAYMAGCHGREALDTIRWLAPKSVVDVGCAGGAFPRLLKREAGIEDVVGVDFALPVPEGLERTTGVEFIRAPAHAIPLNNADFDMVTSFDMLEHLLPEDVPEVLREFKRLSTRWVMVSISYVPSKMTALGENLHMTVRPKAWWRAQLQEIFGVVPTDTDRYLLIDMEP